MLCFKLACLHKPPSLKYNTNNQYSTHGSILAAFIRNFVNIMTIRQFLHVYQIYLVVTDFSQSPISPRAVMGLMFSLSIFAWASGHSEPFVVVLLGGVRRCVGLEGVEVDSVLLAMLLDELREPLRA